MNVSMDGLRKGATSEMNNLGRYIKSAIVNEEFTINTDELMELFNSAAEHVDMFNCIYDAENESFNDLSDEIEVMRLGESDLPEAARDA